MPTGQWKNQEKKEARHKHPSVNCYKMHGCRCAGCRELHSIEQTKYRQKRAERIAAGRVPLPKKSVNAQRVPKPGPLSLGEVERLRQLIGFDPNKDYGAEDLQATWEEKARVKGYKNV